METSTAAHPSKIKRSYRVKNDIAKVLHNLFIKLERDGYTDVLAYLPGPKLLDFSHKEYNGRNTVQLRLGLVKGLVYACAEGQVVRKNANTGNIIDIIDADFAKVNYSSVFQPPEPFGWVWDIKVGLSTPMKPRSLALIQFYSLLACKELEWLDRDLPIPDYGSLCEAFESLKLVWEFRKLVTARPDLATSYELPNFGIYSEYASSSSEADSISPTSGPASKAVSENVDDLFDEQGLHTRLPAQKDSPSPSQSVVSNKGHGHGTRDHVDTTTKAFGSSREKGFSQHRRNEPPSLQPSHAASEAGRTVADEAVSSVLELARSASLPADGDSALSAIAPASANITKHVPFWFEGPNGIHLNATLEADEKRLMAIICAPDAKALDIVRENVTEDRLAAIWTWDPDAFEQQDDSSLAMLKLSLHKAKMTRDIPGYSVFAFIGSGWNKFLRPNLTLKLETGRTRSGGVTVRDLLSKGEMAKSGTSTEIDDVVKASKAKDMQELTAMIMYAFLLAREDPSNGWQDNIVPIYPGFLLDLHRLGSRLLAGAAARRPTSARVAAYPPINLRAMNTPPSAGSVRRGDNRVGKPYTTGAIVVKGTNSPSLRHANGRRRIVEPSSNGDHNALPSTTPTPDTKSKLRNPIGHRRNEPHPPAAARRARIVYDRARQVERRLHQVREHEKEMAEIEAKISGFDEELAQEDGLDELLAQQENNEENSDDISQP